MATPASTAPAGRVELAKPCHDRDTATYALGWRQGMDVVVADTVINDITVSGRGQTVLLHSGAPFLWDRGL